MNRPLIIYHANCADGFGAAYAAWKRFGDDADYVPCQYGDAPPDVQGRADVYIVDFSFPREVLLGLSPVGDDGPNVIVMDHHETARDDLAGEWPNHMIVRFDMTRSGAAMAWFHFNGGPALPALIEYIEDRDLWKWKLPHSKEVSAAIRSYPFDFAIWDAFDTGRLATEGSAILRYVDQQVAGIAANARLLAVGAHNVPVVQCPAFLSSEVGNVLAEGQPFAATWCASADGTELFWSLRSAKDGLHVGNLARQFGGGGHAHAAGYKTKGGGIG